MFQPAGPLMSAPGQGWPVSPCVRYTGIPLHQTMFSLAMPEQGTIKAGNNPGPPIQLCQPLPEVSLNCRDIRYKNKNETSKKAEVTLLFFHGS